MKCTIVSRAGQVLTQGHLKLHQEESGAWRLDLETVNGRLIQGGTIEPDGDLTAASEVLFREFFAVWGMSDLTLTIKT